MTPPRKQSQHVVETETVEVEVDKGVATPELRIELSNLIAAHLSKWMSQNEAAVESERLVVKLEQAGSRAVR